MKGKAHRKQLSRNLNIDNSRVDREFRRNEVKFEELNAKMEQKIQLSFLTRIIDFVKRIFIPRFLKSEYIPARKKIDIIIISNRGCFGNNRSGNKLIKKLLKGNGLA